jgi:hypothetical protein
MGRAAAGVDINPVAYCVSSAKAEIPPLQKVLARIDRLEGRFRANDPHQLEEERQALPPFFRRAFYHSTLRELLFLRRALRWQKEPVDRFVAALALGSLHGDINSAASYFSNQMPRTISTKPEYSIRYWKKHRLHPKKRFVFQMLRAKARLRLSGELPVTRGRIALADARRAAAHLVDLTGSARLILTSPPYLDVTRYEEDQWLRLWFLGSMPHPTYNTISKDDRYENVQRYWQFLTEAWQGVAPLVQENARMVCRLGAKGITEEEMTEGFLVSIRAAFPAAELLETPSVSPLKRRQTDNFRPGTKGCLFEVDYTLSLN